MESKPQNDKSIELIIVHIEQTLFGEPRSADSDLRRVHVANMLELHGERIKSIARRFQSKLSQSEQRAGQLQTELNQARSELTTEKHKAQELANQTQTELQTAKNELDASETLRRKAEALTDQRQTELQQVQNELANTQTRLQNAEKLAEQRRTGLASMKQHYERQIDEIKQHARDDSVKTMFQIADETNHALEIADSMPDIDSVWLSGLQITNDNINKLISEQGYERFAQVGDQFDPALHNATKTVETSKYPNRTITQVFIAGYRNLSSGSVVRHAQVVVAVAPPEGNSSSIHNCCGKPTNANVANQEERI